MFLVNNGHSATKVHANKVQYCRAGHFVTLSYVCGTSSHTAVFIGNMKIT